MHGIIFGGTPMLQRGELGIYQDSARAFGAHKIASTLRDEGWDIEVCDFFFSWTLEELISFCKSRITDKTVFIGFSVQFPQKKSEILSVNNFFKMIKRRFSHVATIMGGPHFGNMKKFEADYYVMGWAEKAMPALLKYLTNSGSDVTIRTNKLGQKVVDCNHDYPAFPMKRIRTRYEERDFIMPYDSLSVEFARGCIFQCKFCNFPVLGVKTDHTRDAEDYRDELWENYDKWGVTTYTVSDETINDYTEKLKKFGDVTKELPFQPWLGGFVRGDVATARKQDWDHMIDMGLLAHWYGIESFNHPSAKYVGKGMNPNRLKEGLVEIREYFKKNAGNYRATASFIYGLPHDTYDTLREQEKWLLKYWHNQDAIVYTLQIRDQELTDFDAISTISRNFDNLGYTKYSYEDAVSQMLKRKHNDPHFKDMYDDLLRDKQIYNDQVFWKNSETGLDYFECNEMRNDFMRNYDEIRSPGTYHIHHWLQAGYTLDDMEKPTHELSGTGKPTDLPPFHHHVKYIEEYKQKKLAL